MMKYDNVLRIFVLTVFFLVGSYAEAAAQNTAAQHSGRTITVQVDTLSSQADTSSASDTAKEKISEITELITSGVVFLTLLILIVAYFLNRFMVRVLENLSEKASKYRLAIKRLVPVSRIAIWSFALYIIIAGIIDPPFETVITVLASIGIAVGFASQDILKNVFGGLIIILDRPFQVGDKIEVDNYYGEVKQIGLRSCRIVTPDDSIVTIPNGDLMTKAVSNANSSALDCQVVAEIFLPAEVDIEQVKRIAYKAAISSRYVYLQKPVSVIVKNEIHEKNFVIKLRVKAYVLDIRYEFPFQSDMTELIWKELNKKNILGKPSEYSHN